MTSTFIVGTYSESLGHVDGKGKGVYALRFDRKGLSIVSSDGDSFVGKPQLGGIGGLTNPTFIASYRDTTSSVLYLYIVDEAHTTGPGTISAVRVNEQTFELTKIGPSVPADNRAAPAACCHVSVSPEGQYVLGANYLSGSVCAIARLSDGTLDPSRVQYVQLPPASHPVTFPLPNAARQESSHAHMALFSIGTDRTSLLVPDLGSDTVWCIPYESSTGGTARSPLGEPSPTARHAALAGAGPRHIALHPTLPVAYVGYELASLVAAFALDPQSGALTGDPLGVWNVLEGVASTFMGGPSTTASADYASFLVSNLNEGVDSLRPSGHGRTVCSDARTSIAAVRVAPDGSHVFVSSRIVDAPGALSAIPLSDAGTLIVGSHAAAPERPLHITSTLGRTPRDFVVLPAIDKGDAPMLALVANQDDDRIVLLCPGNEAKELTTAVPTPVCLCIVPP